MIPHGHQPQRKGKEAPVDLLLSFLLSSHSFMLDIHQAIDLDSFWVKEVLLYLNECR